MPGPDNIFVLTESLTSGRRTGIAISPGLASGVLIHTLAAATGLSIIKYIGAAYLFFLAFYNLTHTFVLMRVRTKQILLMFFLTPSLIPSQINF